MDSMIPLPTRIAHRRRFAFLTLSLLLAMGLLTGCPADEPEDQDVGIDEFDVEEGDTDLDEEDPDQDEDPDNQDSNCVLELETSTGLVLAETREDPIEAETRPLICWTVPEGAALPEADAGWTLRVEREEFAGTEIIANLHWYLEEGIPPELTQLPYGDCPEEVDTCTEARDLTAGTYFLHLFDAGRPDGLAASLVFVVEEAD